MRLGKRRANMAVMYFVFNLIFFTYSVGLNKFCVCGVYPVLCTTNLDNTVGDISAQDTHAFYCY